MPKQIAKKTRNFNYGYGYQLWIYMDTTRNEYATLPVPREKHFTREGNCCGLRAPI
jgi:hypothetical protein